MVAAVAAHASPAEIEPSERTLNSRTPLLIQEGAELQLMGVTDDNFAIYQQGQTLYATALIPGAHRQVIAEVPNNNVVQILQVGNVVMAWIDPQRSFPGFGISPLVIWSAASGAHRISEDSAVGLVATDANSNNLQVLYTTNVTGAGGLRGDLVLSDVFTAFRPRTLLSNIKLDFPFGQCRPVAAFIGPPGRAVPTAEYCVGNDTTATLSRWVFGRKIDLIKNIATQLPFTLETNPQQTEFFVRLAGSGDPVVVTDEGQIRVVDNIAGNTGFVTDRGSAVYSAQRSPTGLPELRFAPRGKDPFVVSNQFYFAFSSIPNLSGYAKRQTPSPDGRFVLYATNADPITFLTDMQLLDLHTGITTSIDTRFASFGGIEVFTEDSSHALYFSDYDLNVGLSALFAADHSGVTRQISEDRSVLFNFAASGSAVSYNNHPHFDSGPVGSFDFSTADLHVVDSARPDATRLIATQAHIFYYPSHHRRGLVFTSDTEATPGLYLANARP